MRNVERERSAREWLRDAQTAAGGVRTRGLQATQVIARDGSRETKKRANDELRGRLGIELSFILQRQADGVWKACFEVPDLSPVITSSPQIEQALSSCRCIISTGGNSSTARPGKWLLNGPRQISLTEWPLPDKPLIKLDHASQEASAIIEALFYLHPKQTWLFRVFDNGIAREVKSNRVKPGGNYLLISTSTISLSTIIATPVSLSCKGVMAVFLKLPDIIPKQAEQEIIGIGLAIIKGLSLWPVGIPPASWDGDGRVEWLINDPFIIAVKSDYNIQQIKLSLNERSGQCLNVPNLYAGQVVYIELPRLECGIYHIDVTLFNPATLIFDPYGQLEVVIREPRSTDAWRGNRSPITLHTDTLKPSFEQIWEGTTSLQIKGPLGNDVSVYINFYEQQDTTPLISMHLPRLALPVTSEQWETYFETYFRKRHEVQEQYDSARLCEIVIDAVELGKCNLLCERTQSAIRWRVRRQSKKYVISLLDDTGLTTRPDIRYYQFEQPAEFQIIDDAFFHSDSWNKVGGMFTASIGNYASAIVIPPIGSSGYGFADLRFSPRYSINQTTVKSITGAIALYSIWSSARVPGDTFAAIRRWSVLEAISRGIVSAICGSVWAKTELPSTRKEVMFDDYSLCKAIISYEPESNKEKVLKTLRQYPQVAKSSLVSRLNFFYSLALLSGWLEGCTRTWVIQKGSTPQPTSPKLDPKLICETSFLLACSPSSINASRYDNISDYIDFIIQKPQLLRAARYAVLVTDNLIGPQSFSSKSHYAGWVWE